MVTLLHMEAWRIILKNASRPPFFQPSRIGDFFWIIDALIQIIVELNHGIL